MHAQDIIVELRGSLDLTAWDGAKGLAQLYGFLVTELIKANVQADADKAASCRALVEPLRDAWREAYVMTQAEPAGAVSAQVA
jgi:flagellar protein FliS